MLRDISRIIGKWNVNEYKILQKIGEGAMGEIYKVKDSWGNIRAMKISDNISSITREFDIMKELSFLDGVPKVYELDDYYHRKIGTTLYFFVMELVIGNNLKEIIKKERFPIRDTTRIGLIILKILKKINEKGYTYTDIKLENILIDKNKHRIIIVDFGGVINNQWGIREYTPTYNMISWGINVKYNPIESTIFGVAMLMTSLILRKEYSPLFNRISDIVKQIRGLNIDVATKGVLINGLKVKYKGIDEFINELNKLTIKLDIQKQEKRKSLDIINLFFIVSLCVFLLTIVYGLNIINK